MKMFLRLPPVFAAGINGFMICQCASVKSVLQAFRAISTLFIYPHSRILKSRMLKLRGI